MFEVFLTPSAQESYDKADQPLRTKLMRCFRRLELDPRHGNNIKRLTGDWAGYLRYRVGDWRVIYRVEDETSRVYVVTTAHRSEVYE